MTEKQRKYGYVTADPILYSALREHADRMKKYPTEAEFILWITYAGSNRAIVSVDNT